MLHYATTSAFGNQSVKICYVLAYLPWPYPNAFHGRSFSHQYTLKYHNLKEMQHQLKTYKANLHKYNTILSYATFICIEKNIFNIFKDNQLISIERLKNGVRSYKQILYKVSEDIGSLKTNRKLSLKKSKKVSSLICSFWIPISSHFDKWVDVNTHN